MINLHHFSITQHCPDITLYLLLIPSSWVKFQSCVFFYICSLCILVPITYFLIPPTHEFPLNTYYLLPNHFIAQLLNHWTLGSFFMYYLLLIAYYLTRAYCFLGLAWSWPGPALWPGTCSLLPLLLLTSFFVLLLFFSYSFLLFMIDCLLPLSVPHALLLLPCRSRLIIHYFWFLCASKSSVAVVFALARTSGASARSARAHARV